MICKSFLRLPIHCKGDNACAIFPEWILIEILLAWVCHRCCAVAVWIRHAVVCGLQSVTRCLERDELRLVIVDRSSPWQLHQHLAQLSAVRQCPAMALDNVANTLCTVLAVTRLCALGFKVGHLSSLRRWWFLLLSLLEYRYLLLIPNSSCQKHNKNYCKLDFIFFCVIVIVIICWYSILLSCLMLCNSLPSLCLDYCNSLIYGISDILFRHLQAVQNAAARLVAGTQRCDHISKQQLHWLSVWHVEFKLAVLVYKALNNLAPPYLSDDCQLVATTGCR